MSQGALQIPTAQPGSSGGQSSAMAALINAAILGAASFNAGNTAPANGPSGAPFLGQTWLNTSTITAETLAVYDGAQWLNFLAIDTVGHKVTGTFDSLSIASAATFNGGVTCNGAVVFDAAVTFTGFGPGTLGLTSLSVALAGGYVTPQMYGCAGDGTTDDTTNLSTCLNSGKPVLLVGKFKITSMITVNLSATGSPKGIRILGAGEHLSQILVANTAAGITINVPYQSGNTLGSGPLFNLENFVLIPTVTNHGAVASFNGTTGVISSGGFTALLNIIGSAVSGSMIGTGVQNGFITNVGVVSDGAGWTNCGLFLQDLRFFRVCGFYCPSGVGAVVNGSTGHPIAYWSTNKGSAIGNAPCNFVFDACNIIGGFDGIALFPSGLTSVIEPNDWEGCTITNCTLIGQADASIRACGSDGTTNGLFVSNCNLQANGCGVYAYGVGGPQIMNNLTVVTSNGAIGINHLKGGNGFGDHGVIIGNTTFRGGAFTGCAAASSNGASVQLAYNTIN